jgi:hypothetical protein
MDMLGAPRTMGRVYGWLLIERLPRSTRQHLYRVTPGGFTSVLSAQLSRMKFGIDTADFWLSLLDKTRTEETAMTTAKVDFSSVGWGSVEWTNLVTLYLRAYESRSPRPILGDQAAAEAVGRIDYDFKRMHRAAQPWANQFLVALRAKKLDA